MSFFAYLESVSMREAPTACRWEACGYLQSGAYAVNPKIPEKCACFAASGEAWGLAKAIICAAHTRIKG
jgi:hypothetical protein